MNKLLEQLHNRPVIAAARDTHSLDMVLLCPAVAVFLLGGTILSLREEVARVREKGKLCFVHLDLMEGLGHDKAAVDWLFREARPDGLISTRQPLLRHARERGLLTVQRVFVMDSSSIQSGVRLLKNFMPDMVELLPGLMPKAIVRLKQELPDAVIIAGGLITEPNEVYEALASGALAVSSAQRSLWDYEP